MPGNECDVTVVVGALIVFVLPLTLLFPEFCLWDVVPKIQVIRFHIISLDVTWPQFNAGIIGLLVCFYCLCLEIRKRKLDDMVENVLTVSQGTEVTLAVEKGRQAAAIKTCVELLDASTDHYEHLVLLSNELRQREVMKNQHPPVIELSTSEF
ncbi:Uncharacterized protein OBRU01_00538 [Operophtera brumata]|uniref:Uncharacterized protein n=1 Tax=Operophtera brumata TaxID=104452 RepID=A0A0L7LV31_OPEBR|nr:Uncharacterized protein OBRU01_00538 [Operophtera brumata]